MKKDYFSDSDNGQAIWNMDDQRLRLLDQLMNTFEYQVSLKNVNGMYETLRALKRNSKSALLPNDRKDLDTQFNNLTNLKNNIKDKKTFNKFFSDYYYLCETIYELIQQYLVDAGFFFRKGMEEEGL